MRFYENEYPNVDDVVMVKIQTIRDIGVNVTLLEYNKIEGLMLMNELSRKRVRSVHKLVRIGRKEAAVVLRVDPVKGYIDLSKKRITLEDTENCVYKFHKSKLVDHILRIVSDETGTTLAQLYEQFAWPLERVYGSAYAGFRGLLLDQETVASQWSKDVDDTVKQCVLDTIQARMAPQPTKVSALISATCYDSGITGLQEILRAGLAVDDSIAVNYISSPIYAITIKSVEEQVGIDLIQKAIVSIQESAQKHNGVIEVYKKPQARTTQLTWMEEAEKLMNKDKEDTESVASISDSGSNSDTDNQNGGSSEAEDS